MNKPVRLDFNVLNKYVEEKCGGKEFFIGCWSPEPLNIHADNKPNNIQFEKGENWAVLRNGADHVDGLVFPKIQTEKTNNHEPELVVFKGYLSEDSIHSYSSANDVRKYWSNNHDQRHNGIFCAAIIDDQGQKLKIVTDIFGVSPIFYRKIGNVVFFASAPGFLSLKDDDADMMSWTLRMVLGYVPGDTTLSKSIYKAPSCSVLTFSKEGEHVEKWYDYNDFAKGEKPVDDKALKASEKSLSIAVKRCQNINYGSLKLPLSSGFDSRRIFAHLYDQKVQFETFTVQMPTGSGEDVDGLYAPMISKDHGIYNTILKIPASEAWHKFDVQRIFSMDSHTDYHTWSVRVFQQYKDQHISFFDGLGGDVFGFYGWQFVYNPDSLLIKKMPKFLSKSIFPPLDKVHETFTKLYNQQPKGINQDVLSFCVWQSRNGTSLWAQQQTLPGQLIFCPYFDLDYIETMLKYSLDKKDNAYILQKEVLKKFWPKLAAYHGSGNLPDNPVKLGDYNDLNKMISFKKLIDKTLKDNNCKAQYKKIFTLHARILLLLARYSVSVAEKINWWAKHIVEMIFWWQSRPFVIKIIENDKVNNEQ